MTLREAQLAITRGESFGSVFGEVSETDREALRYWFVYEHTKPPRPAKGVVTGDNLADRGLACDHCGGFRLRPCGGPGCWVCDDCGTSGGCS